MSVKGRYSGVVAVEGDVTRHRPGPEHALAPDRSCFVLVPLLSSSRWTRFESASTESDSCCFSFLSFALYQFARAIHTKHVNLIQSRGAKRSRTLRYCTMDTTSTHRYRFCAFAFCASRVSDGARRFLACLPLSALTVAAAPSDTVLGAESPTCAELSIMSVSRPDSAPLMPLPAASIDQNSCEGDPTQSLHPVRLNVTPRTVAGGPSLLHRRLPPALTPLRARGTHPLETLKYRPATRDDRHADLTTVQVARRFHNQAPARLTAGRVHDSRQSIGVMNM
jgi:hypothetical protein